MKLIFISLSLFAQTALAQPDTLPTAPLKHRVYKTTIFNNRNQKDFGYLTEINNDSLMLSPIPTAFNPVFPDNKNSRKINYADISTVYLRRTGTTGRSILLGALTGFAAGVIAGFVEGGDSPESLFAMTAGEKAIAYGAMGTVAGAAIGGIIGAVTKKKFTIGGKKKKFDEMRMNVLQKAYGQKMLQ